MLTEMRDTVGLILLGLGVDPSTVTTFDDAAGAFDQLAEAKSNGQIRAFTGNDYLDDLSTGNFAACIGWSGDVVQLSRRQPGRQLRHPRGRRDELGRHDADAERGGEP